MIVSGCIYNKTKTLRFDYWFETIIILLDYFLKKISSLFQYHMPRTRFIFDWIFSLRATTNLGATKPE